MILYFQKAVRDLRANLFLNTVTVITIALSVLIFSAFMLFFINADGLLRHWISDMRIMVYLKPEISPESVNKMRAKIESLPGVREVDFISRAMAMERFRGQLKRQSSLLDGLNENPLPESFEVRLDPASHNWRNIEPIAGEIESMNGVAEVEYGQQWVGKFVYILNLMRVAGYSLGGLFFVATVFFVANTVRLVLYSRRDEVEIMRLVGASESFVKDPFYIQTLLMGTLGGIIGIGILYSAYRFIAANVAGEFAQTVFPLRFLPLRISAGILLGSMFAGWSGCFISLRQFLRS
jgi:cell division transport system permease protein